MGNLISKFIIKDKAKDVVHTSAYGKAQNEGGIGVASTQSFDDRMMIEKNRSRVRKYDDSRVVSQARAASGIRAKTYQPPEKTGEGGIGSKRQFGGGAPTKTEGAKPVTPRINPGISFKN